ncbi:uncharacterized protein LY89DRAFT_235573 [Mollisia scopiformis]|uniref:Uncharacterized protein n=1 Tax=Mollisia scopiformis TaxID=149040 RepID=A0A194WSW7_MOLSC|nr:uncharacterized protein LY89DRAFT_235573 [Mollisia scopiformis]KUJ11048.1 hypothetical protein LY89DRAFT_235573 [Mollisia scopiformis]
MIAWGMFPVQLPWLHVSFATEFDDSAGWVVFRACMQILTSSSVYNWDLKPTLARHAGLFLGIPGFREVGLAAYHHATMTVQYLRNAVSPSFHLP